MLLLCYIFFLIDEFCLLIKTSRLPYIWIYELVDILSLCGKIIFTELHIDHIILGLQKASDIEITIYITWYLLYTRIE
jgi:hypothetical protein